MNRCCQSVLPRTGTVTGLKGAGHSNTKARLQFKANPAFGQGNPTFDEASPFRAIYYQSDEIPETWFVAEYCIVYNL